MEEISNKEQKTSKKFIFSNLFRSLTKNKFLAKKDYEIIKIKSSIKNKVYPIYLQQGLKKSTSEIEIGEFILENIDAKNVSGLENGTQTKFCFQQLNVADLSCAVFSLMGIGLSILSNEIDFVEENSFTEIYITLDPNDLSSIKNFLLYLLMASTILLYFLVSVRYLLMIKWLKARKILSYCDNLFNSGIIYRFLFELFINSLIPTPLYTRIHFSSYNDSIKKYIYYTLNDLLSLLIMLRIFVVARIFLSNSRYTNNSSHRIKALTGCHSHYLYTIKCLLKTNPLQVLLAALLVYILTFAYAIRICERPLIAELIKVPKNLDKNGIVENDLSNYYNDMWLMIVTMSTVGYGDFSPRTMPGRFLTFFACMVGTITVSLVTITLNNLFYMNTSESRSFAIIEKMNINNKRKKHAGFVVTNLAKLGFFNGNLKKYLDKNEKKIRIKKIKDNLKDLKRLDIKEIKAEMANPNEEITRNFGFVREDFKNLEWKLNKLCELNLDILEKLGLINDTINNNNSRDIRENYVYTPILKKRTKRFTLAPMIHHSDIL